MTAPALVELAERELLPCPNPWCKPELPPITISVPDATGAHTLVAKMCYECGCTAPAKPNAAEAIAAWNTRA